MIEIISYFCHIYKRKVYEKCNIFFRSLGHWPLVGSFGLNTDILATYLINLTVFVGVLIFFQREWVRFGRPNIVTNRVLMLL